MYAAAAEELGGECASWDVVDIQIHEACDVERRS